MTWLLDSNVLVALAIDTHEFHTRASRWFAGEKGNFATCAVTQGALLRLHMTLAQDRSAEAAWLRWLGSLRTRDTNIGRTDLHTPN